MAIFAFFPVPVQYRNLRTSRAPKANLSYKCVVVLFVQTLIAKPAVHGIKVL